MKLFIKFSISWATHSRFSFVWITVLSFWIAAPLRAEEWNFSTTRGVVAGVLKWKDSGLESFSDRFRKDAELHSLSIRRGVPASNLKLLLDGAATRAGIESAVREAALNAPADSVFYFYYAGHGIKDASGSYLANYDIDSGSPESTGVNIRRIAEILASSFKGKMVIFTGDFCYSGAFEEALRTLQKKGIRGFMLASASASNESTGNWTFSQTWIDCLSGNPLCDKNGDGKITLGEAQSEVAQAMKFRERQRNGFLLAGVSESLIISSATGKNQPGVGSYVLAPRAGAMLPARITNRNGSRVTCEFYSYSEKTSVDLAENAVKPLNFRQYSVGTNLKVIWNGKSYPATVKKLDNDFHLITYSGYDSSWDEWVMDDRIVADDSVLVEWKGKWYPAKVLKTEGGRSFIHYEGFESSWDEWVTSSRIKKP